MILVYRGLRLDNKGKFNILVAGFASLSAAFCYFNDWLFSSV